MVPVMIRNYKYGMYILTDIISRCDLKFIDSAVAGNAH